MHFFAKRRWRRSSLHRSHDSRHECKVGGGGDITNSEGQQESKVGVMSTGAKLRREYQFRCVTLASGFTFSLTPCFYQVRSSSVAGCNGELQFGSYASSLYLSMKSNATLLLFGVHACAVLPCPAILQQYCTLSYGGMGRAFSVHAAPAGSLWHTCFHNNFGVKIFITLLPPSATVQGFVCVRPDVTHACHAASPKA